MRLSHKYVVAIIYSVVLFLDRLDLTIVNITLPTLAKNFHIPLTSTDWVNLAFLLALAISIPISCWLAERHGFKKIYILSMILFGLASTLCAWAPDINTLIALRFLQGIGGGMLIPVGMTILYRMYDKSEYASITSFTFLPSLIAPAIAPFLGGILLEVWNWRAVFWMAGPICFTLAIASIFLLKERWPKTRNKLDWGGFISFSAILLDVFYILSLFGKPTKLPFIAIGTALLCMLIYYFIRREEKTKLPFFNLQYFKNKNFLNAIFIQLCFQICHFGAIFLVGMYLQISVGLSPALAGLIMGMQAIGAICTSRYSVKLFTQHGAKLPITIGFIGISILSPAILFIHNSSMIGFALLLFFLRGIFSGLCGTPVQALSVMSFEKEQLSEVNTLFNAFRQVSISFGVAISSALMTAGIYFAKANAATHIVNINDRFMVFGLGFLAICLVAIVGSVIVQGLKNPPDSRLKLIPD